MLDNIICNNVFFQYYFSHTLKIKIFKHMVIWTAKDAATATGGKVFSEWLGGKLVFDSRLIEKGDIFIALPGNTSDGHQHVAKALDQGAAAAIVSNIPENVSNEKLLIVNETLKALTDLAKYKQTKTKAKLIAVTGSVGKTSTKELLNLAFSAHGKTFASRGNYNNYLGVPINLASMPDDTEYAIFEIGMDHAGEITPLSNLVKPHIAIITSIENIHRANFDSIEGIAQAKAEIFDGLQAHGTVIINSLSNCYDYLLNKAKIAGKILCIGRDSQLLDYNVRDNHTIVVADILNKNISINLDHILGIHQIYNMIIALTSVASLGLNLQESIKHIQQFQLPRGRGLVSKILVDAKEITLIDDSYNAGPVSVKAALKNMSYYTGRKIAILGDMVDMGPESLKLHIDLKEDIITNNIDKVICFGEQMQSLYQALPEEKKLGKYLHLKDLAQALPNLLETGDILLIKGSFYLTKLYYFTKYLSEGNLDFYKENL